MKTMSKKFLAVFAILIVVLAAVSASTLMNAQPRIVGEVYTIDNAAAGNNVWRFDRLSNGSLVASGNFSTQGKGTGSNLASQGAVTLSNDGKWLLAVDAGSNEITLFMVNGTSLTFADKQSSHGLAPISIAVNGSWVYVLNNGTATTAGNIAGFSLNQTSSKLAFIAGSNRTLSGMPNSSPEQIGFNPKGNVLIVTEKAANITDTYTINSTGVASPPINMSSLSPGPYGFAFNAYGFLVLSEAASNTLSSFALNDNGSLRTLSGSMPDFGNAPCWVAITWNGQIAYTSNAHGGTISGYTISRSGMLNLFSSIAAKTSVPTLDLALTAKSEFLYALNGNNITGFQVFPDGSLWQVSNLSGLPASTTGLAAT
jgi:6-phosphogluconolactonase